MTETLRGALVNAAAGMFDLDDDAKTLAGSEFLRGATAVIVRALGLGDDDMDEVRDEIIATIPRYYEH